MKERLSDENIEALAAYRYGRAIETLAEVPFLKRQGFTAPPSTASTMPVTMRR